MSTCPTTLASGLNCTLYVGFVPQQGGTRSASITVPVDGSGTYQSLLLTGNGTLEGAFEIVSSFTGKVLEISGGVWTTAR